MSDDVIVPPNSKERSYEARRSSRTSETVEVRVRPVRRRDWTPEDRLRIVRETLGPGAVSKVVADRHGISTGLLYTWRKNLLATAMAGFAAVQVVPEMAALPAPKARDDPTPSASGGMSSSVEVTFASGARLVLHGEVAPGVVREIVAELARR